MTANHNFTRFEINENATVIELITILFKLDFELMKLAKRDLERTLLPLYSISKCDYLGTGNVYLAASGLYIAGVSTQNYLGTQNSIAKVWYGASICCSSTAAISGTIKAFGNVCGISYLAMCGDAFGTSFLFLGNRARNLGDLAQGKAKMSSLNPFQNLRNRSFRRASISKGSDSIAFLTGSSGSSDTYFSQIITAIPFQKIILVGGSILTVYAYGKFIISTYRYGKKLVSKFIVRKKMNSSKLIRKQAVFLIKSLITPRLQSQLRIYKFALSYQVL